MSASEFRQSDASEVNPPDASGFGTLARYLRMIKFSHSLYALPLAGIAFLQALSSSNLFTANGTPAPALYWLLLKIVIAMTAQRSAAMGFTRLADRDIDAANPRTASREIPDGQISIKSARLFIGVSLAIFFAAAFSINPICALLAPVAAGLVLGYSYTKRFTFLCHFILGTAIGVAPTAVWLAVLERIDLLPLVWSAGLAIYIAGFDILYACQDADYDREVGLHSVPARFGVPAALWVARLCHLAAIGLFAYAGVQRQSGAIFDIAVVIVAELFVVEHRLVRPGKLERIPIAFFHINASISLVLFLGIALDLWLAPSPG